jgi:FlaA1/EpsC-like NDP-sugar epimerase
MKKIINLLKIRSAAVLIDIFMIPIAWYGVFWLRFNLGVIPEKTLWTATYALPFLIVIQAISFWVFGLYRGIWSFASLPDLIRIFKSVIAGVLLSLIPLSFLFTNIPRSIPFLYAWLLISLLAGSRFLFRWAKNYRSAFNEGNRVLIAGAGAAGDLLLRELMKSNAYNTIAFVDDDPKKQGCELHGIRVLGLLKDIPRIVKKYNIQMVIIAMPSASSKLIQEIVDLCEQVQVPFSTIPKLNDLATGNVSIKTLRDVSIEDLLGREPITLNWEQISNGISGKKILVTGGGGSIGSELCRQIARLAPEELIIIDNSEFNLYSIDRELRSVFPYLHLSAYLLDVTNKSAINRILEEYKPEAIFHAAAYKHVPLLEYQVKTAVRNNILGTRCLAEAAVLHGIKQFTLISTDKAVHPTNIMGATKRITEVICNSLNAQGKTCFTTVRFGNVLGSAGSVVPLFKSQLEQGLPLTVTHPEISRYFMTIPEATQLILQATVIGKGGEVFVLDMGEPITIKFLAEKMIQLSGKTVDDIGIVYTGLRPGEKLHEELFYANEDLVPTEHEKILLSKHKTNKPELTSAIDSFIDKYSQLTEEELKKSLFELVNLAAN